MKKIVSYDSPVTVPAKKVGPKSINIRASVVRYLNREISQMVSQEIQNQLAENHGAFESVIRDTARECVTVALYQEEYDN